jgi:hypothetical protein
MAKFRKKPVVIDAHQWTGDWKALDAWIVSMGYDAWETAADDGTAMWLNDDRTLTIPTLEGDHTAQVNDWIIRGVQGEFYPCKPDIFEATYEAVA